MSVGTLPDPEDPFIIHLTDQEGLVCRFTFPPEGPAWPTDWWTRERRDPQIVVTCIHCVGLRR